MELIETAVFTKQVRAIFSDEEYRAFQLHLVSRPDVGDIIPGSGGLRKVRWRMPGAGQAGRRAGDLLLENSGWPDLSPISVPEKCAE